MRLDEYNYKEISKTHSQIEPYLGKGLWIHFSRVDKVGVNVLKAHNDCYGIYFYPLDWLVSSEDYVNGELHGVTFPNFVIAELSLGEGGIDLRASTEEDWEQLSKKNGWYDQYIAGKSDPIIANYWKNHFNGSVGAEAWGIMKNLVSTKKNKWTTLTKGLKYINDDMAVIHRIEERQVCVMDPSLIKIIYKGETSSSSDVHSFSYWKKPLLNVMNILSQKYGGEITWKNKQASWDCQLGDDISVSLHWHNLTVRVVSKYKNMTTTANIRTYELHQATDDYIIDMVETAIHKIKKVSDNTLNLDFEPFITTSRAALILSGFTTRGSSPVIDIGKGRYEMSSELYSSLPSTDFKVEYKISVTEYEYINNMRIYMNGKTIYSSHSETVDILENMIKRKIQELPHLEKDEVNAVIGYVLNMIGIKSFMYKYYESFDDKNYIHRQIKYALSNIW